MDFLIMAVLVSVAYAVGYYLGWKDGNRHAREERNNHL